MSAKKRTAARFLPPKGRKRAETSASRDRRTSSHRIHESAAAGYCVQVCLFSKVREAYSSGTKRLQMRKIRFAMGG